MHLGFIADPLSPVPKIKRYHLKDMLLPLSHNSSWIYIYEVQVDFKDSVATIL